MGRADVLVIWNRYAESESVADAFERDGGTVIVAENGYLGLDRADRRIYALARHAHNGRGMWFPGGPERLAALNIDLAPMRDAQGNPGDYVLIAPNRSFGMKGGVMPFDWAERRAEQLQRQGERVRVRHHPGNYQSPVPLAHDLAGARRVEIWSSSVGVQALVAGIPVVCHAPWWICKGWEQRGRDRALEDLAWAQWTVEEIAAGAPFHHLLRTTGQAQVAACA